MATYSKWTARIALVALGLVLLVGVSLLPLHTNDGGLGAVWPLSRRFGHRHIIADMEMGVVWIVLGIATVIVALYAIGKLLKRAGWA